MKQFIQCRNCPRNNNPSSPIGYYFTKKGNYEVLTECNCHIKWREEKDLETLCILSGIRPDFTFDDYVGSKSIKQLNCLKKYVENFEKYSYKTMLYIYGSNGTQKTSMAQAAGKYLIQNKYKVHYINMNDLINNLVLSQSSYKEESENYYKSNEIIKKCKECDLLIVDESFDPSKVTIYKSGYQIPFLDSFLRERFEFNKRSIIFISNIKPDQISSCGYGISLQDLVKRNTSNSFLEFNDNYEKNSARNLNPLGLFEENN